MNKNFHIHIPPFSLLPEANSTGAAAIDRAFQIVNVNSAIFFAIVVGVMVYCLIKFRRKSDTEPTSPVDHNLKLEIVWTTIPLIIVMAFFFMGFKGFIAANVPPGDSYEINVRGHQWFWTFQYPNGVKKIGKLVVPVDKDVKLLLSSDDVIHSLFIPEFRVKQDAVPGMYTSLWFKATHIGKTVIECAEYCGLNHSNMLAEVDVVSEADFEKWLQNGGNEKALPPAEMGKQLYSSLACVGCHTTNGAPLVGPTWKGLYGSTVTLSDGRTVKADENYLRESIAKPTAKVVKGFQPIMPVMGLPDDQIDALVAYIKTLK